jgi:hypothetical protein
MPTRGCGNADSLYLLTNEVKCPLNSDYQVTWLGPAPGFTDPTAQLPEVHLVDSPLSGEKSNPIVVSDADPTGDAMRLMRPRPS